MINFTDNLIPETPQEIKDFLKSLGITAIDYPFVNESTEKPTGKREILRPGNDIPDLMEMLLNLSGQHFLKEEIMPLYQGQETAFNLMIKADYLFKRNNKDCIIDLTGLDHFTLSLLKERHFSVLSLSGEKDPSFIVSRTLDFLDIKFDSDPHPFTAIDRGDSRKIMITIPGIIFQDRSRQPVFATHLRLPGEIVSFLSRRGYEILSLSHL